MVFNRKEYMKEYNKEYYQKNKTNLLKQNKEWRQKNKERKKETDMKWRLKNKDTENYKKNKREMSKQLRKKYPERLIARNKARYIKETPSVCKICGSNKNLEKHHPDYSQPLDIVILCKDCHRKVETKIKTELNKK